MPLPSDEKLIKLGEDILAQIDSMFGLHPGFRAAHAKGVLLTGTFTPSPDAPNLTSVPHFASGKPLPITVRFSSSSTLPSIPDTSEQANPRGFALRFHLGDRVHTDIIGHGAPLFPTRTGQEFLEFLKAASSSGEGTPHPTPIEAFLGSHPAALKFVQYPKPIPTSFAHEAYYALTAFKFTNEQGVAKFGRYIVTPDAGVDHLPNLPDNANYLYDEIKERIPKGPISFKLAVQVANDDDEVNDITNQWPEDRPRVQLGSFTLDKLVSQDEQAKDQKYIIFDPIPRNINGLEPSDDPILHFRAAIYLLSGRRRRAAPDAASED